MESVWRAPMQKGVQLAAGGAGLFRQLSCSNAGAGSGFDVFFKPTQEFRFAGLSGGLCWSSPEHKGAFPLGRMLTKVLSCGTHRWADLLLISLGKFSGDLQGPILAAL